ncbi:MAG: hypothetical protein CM1200mP18_17940 [Gammaproteobacteria bacterium]|nr:MAG: hypothetical protein CM1200mP18_17940 [Gammaproteobacteria bacterium]
MGSSDLKNRIRENWAENRAVVNGWLSIPSTVTAEINARAGFDSLTVDLQQGLNDYQSALNLLQIYRLENRHPCGGFRGWKGGISVSCLMQGRWG